MFNFDAATFGVLLNSEGPTGLSNFDQLTESQQIFIVPQLMYGYGYVGNFALEYEYEEEIECEDDEIPCEALSLWVSESFDEDDFEEAINNANQAISCNCSVTNAAEIYSGLARSYAELENNDKVSIQTLSQGEFESASRKTILDKILKANLFPLIRQRPFNKVADPNDIPRDIFISGHNSSPLSVDLSRLIKDEKDIFQTGLNVLKKLTK